MVNSLLLILSNCSMDALPFQLEPGVLMVATCGRSIHHQWIQWSTSQEPDKKMIYVYHKGEKNCAGTLKSRRTAVAQGVFYPKNIKGTGANTGTSVDICFSHEKDWAV